MDSLLEILLPEDSLVLPTLGFGSADGVCLLELDTLVLSWEDLSREFGLESPEREAAPLAALFESSVLMVTLFGLPPVGLDLSAKPAPPDDEAYTPSFTFLNPFWVSL